MRSDKNQSYFQMGKGLTLLCGIPTLIFAAIMITNMLWSGHISFASSARTGFFPHTLFFLPKTITMFLIGASLRLDTVLHYANLPFMIQLLLDIGSISLLAAITFWIMRKPRDKVSLACLVWFLCSIFSLVAMFAFLGLRNGYNPYIDHSRFFYYLFPVFLLAIFIRWSELRNNRTPGEKYIAYMGLCIAFGVCALFSFHRAQLNNSFELKSKEPLQRLQALKNQFPGYALFIAADGLFPAFVINGYDNLSLFSEPMQKKENFFSRPTLVAVFHDNKPTKEMYANLTNLDKVVQRYQLKHEVLPHDIDLYWNVLPAGPAPAYTF